MGRQLCPQFIQSRPDWRAGSQHCFSTLAQWGTLPETNGSSSKLQLLQKPDCVLSNTSVIDLLQYEELVKVDIPALELGLDAAQPCRQGETAQVEEGARRYQGQAVQAHAPGLVERTAA